jgi:hypothetical protein
MIDNLPNSSLNRHFSPHLVHVIQNNKRPLRTIYDILLLTNPNLLTADTVLWCTKFLFPIVDFRFVWFNLFSTNSTLILFKFSLSDFHSCNKSKPCCGVMKFCGIWMVLGAFARLRKANFNFVMSASPSVYLFARNNLAVPGGTFMKFYIWIFFKNIQI